MNRQSKSSGLGMWNNRGPVSFKDAAIAEAEYVKNMLHGRTHVIEVRDEAEPEIIHTLTVSRHETYHVKGLRKGD